MDDENYQPPHPRAGVGAYVPTILDEDWDLAYRRSMRYGEVWKRVRGEISGDWPKDVKI